MKSLIFIVVLLGRVPLVIGALKFLLYLPETAEVVDEDVLSSADSVLD